MKPRSDWERTEKNMDAMSKVEGLIAETKLKELLHRTEAEKQKNTIVWVLAIIGAIAAVAAIAGPIAEGNFYGIAGVSVGLVDRYIFF